MAIVVNFFGAPCAGKSKWASIIYGYLKEAGVSCELVTEFAKDCIWENNTTALECDEYIFGTQSYRLHKAIKNVDVVVTDSPLPCHLIHRKNSFEWNNIIWDTFNQYDNINFFVKLNSDKIDLNGRIEKSIDELIKKERKLEDLITDKIDFIYLTNPEIDLAEINLIINNILAYLNTNKIFSKEDNIIAILKGVNADE